MSQNTTNKQSKQLINPQKLSKISLDFGINLLSSFQNKIITNFQTVSDQIQGMQLKQLKTFQMISELQKNARQMSGFIQSLRIKKPQSPIKNSKTNMGISKNIGVQVKGTKNESFGMNTQKNQVCEIQSQYQPNKQLQIQTIQNETQADGSLFQIYISDLVKLKIQEFLNSKQTLTPQSKGFIIQKQNKNIQQVKPMKPSINSQNQFKVKEQVQNSQYILPVKKNQIEKPHEEISIKEQQHFIQKANQIKVKKVQQKRIQKQSSDQHNVPSQDIQAEGNFQFKKQPQQLPSLKDMEQKLLKQLSLKFMQLNARVYKIEQNSLNQIKMNSKKFNDIQKSIQDQKMQTKKYLKGSEKYEQEVQKLRNQLNEYKLKKESKLMKLINSASVNSSGNGSAQQNQVNKHLDYLSQNIQFLLKAVTQLVPKQRYNEDIQYIHQIFGSFRKKVANVVNQKQLQQKLNLMEKRIVEELAICFQAKHQDQNKNKLLKLLQEKNSVINKSNLNSQENGQSNQKQKEETYINKILNTQKLLNSILEEFDQVKKSHRKLKNIQYPELQTSVALQKQLAAQIKEKVNNHQSFFRDMNSEYNKKIHEIQGQIINDQQSIDKINNQLKFYKFTNSRSDSTKADFIVPHYNRNQTQIQYTKSDEMNPGDVKSEQYMIKNNLNLKTSLDLHENMVHSSNHSSNLQNDVQQLKKKIGKMSIIIETLKSQMTALRGDLFRDIESIRVNQDKKVDWETFKKGMAYFDEKIKDTNQQINQILISIQSTEKQQSTAAKKGWTCLCCDKDIKSFQGRLGQAKFTSVFPGKHDSPRIGGYYKQNSKQKQYNQLYINKSRRGSIQKIVKQQLQQLK